MQTALKGPWCWALAFAPVKACWRCSRLSPLGAQQRAPPELWPRWPGAPRLLAKWAIAILLPSMDRIVRLRPLRGGTHVVAYSRLAPDVDGVGSSCRLLRPLR